MINKNRQAMRQLVKEKQETQRYREGFADSQAAAKHKDGLGR